MNARSPEMQTCIQACLTCHASCVESLQHSLHKGGPAASQNHLRLLEDCAQIAQTAADFMLRASDLHAQICRACAVVCLRCSQSCEKVGPDDAFLTKCGDACRKAAETCQKMAA